MSFVSRVADGKIRIPRGVNLSADARVRVGILREETLATQLRGVIGSLEGLPPDFAARPDHYVRGACR